MRNEYQYKTVLRFHREEQTFEQVRHSIINLLGENWTPVASHLTGMLYGREINKKEARGDGFFPHYRELVLVAETWPQFMQEQHGIRFISVTAGFKDSDEHGDFRNYLHYSGKHSAYGKIVEAYMHDAHLGQNELGRLIALKQLMDEGGKDGA
ncbi:hypothetical protein [Paenibacillus silvisoli]|uniref:hypothetical protein n=1 Tax=Paenibacillus silvisoli TaxID=3110539 RepID=UPI002804A5C3|nr:hypothetical protein [Paenibacillus silvisoli]